jgi:Cu(I)/Ag(I) efflux system protein CusF
MFVHIIAALALTITLGAQAQTPPAAGGYQVTRVAATGAPKTDGEVRKIDKDQSKVTLKHGPITNLDMPGMTMVFKAATPKMLDRLKEGDRVKFAADNVNGALTLTAIEIAN